MASKGRTIRLSGGLAKWVGSSFFFFFFFFLNVSSGQVFFFFFYLLSQVFFFFFFLTVRRLWKHFWCKTSRGLRGWAPEKQAIYRHSGPYWRVPGVKPRKILLFYAFFALFQCVLSNTSGQSFFFLFFIKWVKFFFLCSQWGKLFFFSHMVSQVFFFRKTFPWNKSSWHNNPTDTGTFITKYIYTFTHSVELEQYKGPM